MNSATLLTLLGSLGIPIIVTALFKLYENRATLKATAPKTDAEALDIGIGSQRKIIDSLTAENARLSAKMADLETDSEEREARLQLQVETLREGIAQTRVDLTEQLIQTRFAHNEQINRLKMDNQQFRHRVEALLVGHGIAIPSWWPSS